MKTFVFVILLLVSTIATAQSVVEVNVPPGDLDALRLAMSEAASGDPSVTTIIYTSGTFYFPKNELMSLPDVLTSVEIEGRADAITFVGVGAGAHMVTLIRVEPEGRLSLHNIELKGFAPSGSANLILNNGILELSQMQIDSVEGSSYCGFIICIYPEPIIFNSSSGRLHLDQVSFVNTGTNLDGGIIYNDGNADIQNTQVYYSRGTYWAAPFKNKQFMSLKNISMFITNRTQSQLKNLPIETTLGAITEVSNSVFSGFLGAWCDTAISLGYNLIDDDRCDFNADGDVTGKPAGLLWRPIGNDLRSGWYSSSGNPILKNALVPSLASPAVDSIDPELCPQDDLLSYPRGRYSDGNGDGISKCDKGAVELQPAYVAAGGINGVYYNPDADGHYITIIDNPYNTLVMWNSFDKDGNQYFVHGTGELVADRSLIADAYINVSGSTSPDGEIVPAQELHWGTLEVEMTSCNEGILAFNSDFPEVGSGQVRLERLVFVKQLGCVD